MSVVLWRCPRCQELSYDPRTKRCDGGGCGERKIVLPSSVEQPPTIATRFPRRIP